MAETNSKVTRKSSAAPQIDRGALETRINDLAAKFVAIRRLAWDIEASNLNTRSAAIQGVDAMALLGALEADDIACSIGGEGIGAFDARIISGRKS